MIGVPSSGAGATHAARVPMPVPMPAAADTVAAAQASALEDLCTAMRSAGIDEPERKTRLLVGCLKNGGDFFSLNLTRVRGHLARDLLNMPRAGWLALQRYTQVECALGIQVVEISGHLNINDDRLLNGLKELRPSLAFVSSKHPIGVMACRKFRAELPDVELLADESSDMPPLVDVTPARKANPLVLFAKLHENLNAAVERGKVDDARECVRAIVAARLPPVFKREALLCRMPLADALSDASQPRQVFNPLLSAFADEEPPPLLSRMCFRFKPMGPVGLPHAMQYEAMGAALQEMLASPLIPIEDVALICGWNHAGPEGEFTAAQLAMHRGHPAAAGALVRAVLLEAGSIERQQYLLGALGVTPQEVVDALSQPPWTRWVLTRNMRAYIAASLDPAC